MTRSELVNQGSIQSIMQWAAQRAITLNVTIQNDGRWYNLRSQLLRLDQQLLQITYPVSCEDGQNPEISVGDELTIAFRRGHKKCHFVTTVVMRRMETTPDGGKVDTLLVHKPEALREVQRRAYQRLPVPTNRFIAVKVWQGGLPTTGGESWPICAGRVSNISAGGVLVDIRADQNPKLALGELVGLEITQHPGRSPLWVEGQYRHCSSSGPGRIGLGIQFIGLEHAPPGHATVVEIADFVKSLSRDVSRREGSK